MYNVFAGGFAFFAVIALLALSFPEARTADTVWAAVVFGALALGLYLLGWHDERKGRSGP
jgi:UDP-N-acetylmuramyl pentapeptide phosphotransferase/UDP-N-acetylglucosamine-1-phosphate transferase